MKRFFIFLAIIIPFIFHPFTVRAQDDGAVITISATANSALTRGYGITVHLTNIETEDTFISKKLSVISRNAIIENVPSGQYAVTYAEIPFGDLKWRNWSPELQSFMGIIQVESGKTYYLGTYKATVEGKLKDRRIMLHFKDSVLPDRLLKYLDRHDYPTDHIICPEPTAKSFIFGHASLL